MSPSVLIADNDPAVASLLAEVLRLRGCQVRVCADGEAARARLQSDGCDLLVCDLDMPRVPGLDLLAWLQAQGLPVPVIVISGYLDEALRGRLGAFANVRRVLHKPFDILAFADLVSAQARQTRVQAAATGQA